MIRKRQALFVHCHPKKESFTRWVFDETRATVPEDRWETRVIDLYSEDFSPILTDVEILRRTSFDSRVQEYETLVHDSDLLVFVYPDWWGQMPALLKGWVDRVFRQGVAYDYQGDEDMPKTKVALLGDKSAIVFITGDLYESGAKGTPPSSTNSSHWAIWKNSIGGFTGLKIEALEIFGPLHNSRRSTRLGWLSTACGTMKKYFEARE